jgi:asparagine synthase (glutamine-hydrolysing)
MCGICGIVDYQHQQVDADLVVAMRDVMISRGPDDSGLYVGPNVALGHRRLSIIDLSPAGHQPMGNEDGSVQLVFNGEIYNFQDLRSQLVQAGHRFVSKTDSEVLVHGYEQWGPMELARKMRGMFAAAIWDSKTRQLHLLRDHLGKKPLFYRCHAGKVVFSSDIRSIHRQAGGDLPTDPRAIDEFLYYKVISQERTIFQGVHRLPPAHVATFNPAGVSISRYWQADYSVKQAKSIDDWLEGIDHYLRQAVRRRMVADVPLGGFLSGGVDSSCVCALLAGEAPGRCRTFTVGFNDSARWDEREFSRKVANHIGSDHTELVLEPDVAPILSNLVWQYGEPFGDSSAIPSYLIAQQARKHVTVVLTGDGGDEGFAGYSRHFRAGLDQRLGYLPPFIRQHALRWLGQSAMALAGGTVFARNLDLMTRYAAGDPAALAGSTCWFDGFRRKLYSQPFLDQLASWHPLTGQQEILASLTGQTGLDKALEYILRTTLPNDYLAKVDQATMAHSLEARSPLLDIDLLNFAMTIPAEALLVDNQPKGLLKRYAAKLVPPEVIYRRKHGFSVPVRQWIKGPWQEPMRRLILSPTCLGRGYFNADYVRRIFNEHVAGRAGHGARLWTLLVLEIWHRLFVDKTLRPGEPVLE